MQTRSFQ